MTPVSPTPPTPFDVVRARQLTAVGNEFLRHRPIVVAPTIAIIGTCLVLSEAPTKQIIGVVVGASLTLAFFLWEARAVVSRPASERDLFRSLVITLVALSIACALTGAIRSPLIPLLFAPVVITFSAYGRTRKSWAAFALGLLLAAALGAFPRGWPFRPIPSPYDAIMLLACFAAALRLLRRGVTGLTDAFLATARSLDRLRADVLSESADRMRSMDAMGSKVAHELRTPLTSIKGLVQLLARSAESKDSRRIEVIKSEISRLEEILDSYLSFSRPIDELRREETDLLELCHDAAAVAEGKAITAGVALSVTGDPVTAWVDGTRLKQGMLNLLTNAIDASPRGRQVAVAIERRAASCRLTVRDNGAGISPEEKAKVGTPFFTTKEHGSGLGLVVTKSIVRQHGGELSLSGGPGTGTTVTIDLPIAEGSSA